MAHFGYENKGKKTLVIDESGSVVTYNHGQAKKYGIYTFEPGVKEKAFSQEFDHKDRVEWTVVFPDGTEKTTDANINSNHCRGAQESLNIIPGYNPPEGATDAVFQIDGTRVLIEVVANSG
ncbi:MAG: hypothetical protein P1P86_13835 [Bacteroidales bacterium]|nr:hypothetical protein [Bacteroidales bacterium]